MIVQIQHFDWLFEPILVNLSAYNSSNAYAYCQDFKFCIYCVFLVFVVFFLE